LKKNSLFVFGAATALLLGASVSFAQDAVSTQPENNKVLFENDRVRVIEVKFGPGTPLKTHSHPAHVVYMVEGGKATFTNADGKATEVETKPGMVRWSDPVTHTVEASAPAHAIVVELKK
jgi:quercetin dioxygenase-like cupin family protein